ncbi:MAG: 30S ribosomal protein S17 [Opitutales bacterium]|nr:30S ribosomal protein S17 [Opitutales bacterium]|tara:strand:+ start:864 stop:1193 length:330 start_codon:yes stop_codon:yes gene_type:complete
METIRNSRKELTGIVTSISGEKSIKVTYGYKIPHPKYRKVINRKTVVHVHDEESNARLGDRVAIMETRPISRMKRWRLVEVIDRAPVYGETLNAEVETAEAAKVATEEE